MAELTGSRLKFGNLPDEGIFLVRTDGPPGTAATKIGSVLNNKPAQLTFLIPPGHYRLEVRARSGSNKHRTGELVESFTVVGITPAAPRPNLHVLATQHRK